MGENNFNLHKVYLLLWAELLGWDFTRTSNIVEGLQSCATPAGTTSTTSSSVCWCMSIWHSRLPDKACSDVWVSTQPWKILKLVPSHRRSFLPTSELLLLYQFSFSSVSRQITPRARLERKHRWDSQVWQVYRRRTEKAERRRVSLGPGLNCT